MNGWREHVDPLEAASIDARQAVCQPYRFSRSTRTAAKVPTRRWGDHAGSYAGLFCRPLVVFRCLDLHRHNGRFYNESELIRSFVQTSVLAVFSLGPRRSLREEEMAFIIEARLLT